MFSYNFKYEFKLLIRNKWIQILSVIIAATMFFAGYNGKQRVDKRTKAIAKVKIVAAQKDKAMLRLLDSVERGYNIRTSLTNPVTIGNYYPRVAAMTPQDLAFVAIGQSDLFTHYVQPRIYGDNFALNYTEMTSPVQLLFGSFDLSFVIIYVLPLLIIAFTYNILSGEKESGVLKLLASQPLSTYQWVLHRTALRFFWLLLITIAVFVVVFVANGFSFMHSFGNFVSFIALVTAYMLFWFALACVMNLFVGNSAKNAVSLLGLWVVLVLLIPAVINQLGTMIYPIPSRTKMLNEVRVLKSEATKKQDEILDNYLRDHPEYALKDGIANYTFWHRYMASQKLLVDQIKPLLDSYDHRIQKQQKLVNRLQYISPAVIVQQSLNTMAGTSSADYGNFRKQVIAFSEQWRDFIVPMLYKNTVFTSSMYGDLPQFVYKPAKQSPFVLKIAILLLFSSVIVVVGWCVFKQKTAKNGILLSG